jgi:hypothetical protein
MTCGLEPAGIKTRKATQRKLGGFFNAYSIGVWCKKLHCFFAWSDVLVSLVILSLFGFLGVFACAVLFVFKIERPFY